MNPAEPQCSSRDPPQVVGCVPDRASGVLNSTLGMQANICAQYNSASHSAPRTYHGMPNKMHMKLHMHQRLAHSTQHMKPNLQLTGNPALPLAVEL